MDGEDYFKQLDLMASTGDDFDIMMFNNPDDLVKRIDAGLVEPINSYLDEEDIDIDEVYRNSYPPIDRSEEHTSELQSRGHLVCRLLLEKKNNKPLNRNDI